MKVGPFDPQTLRKLAQEKLEAVGFDQEDAFYIADSLVEAELRGLDSHGLVRLGIYLERVRQNAINPQARPQVLREGPATLALDAQNGHGIPTGVRAMARAIEKAQTIGVGVVTVCNSNHFGAAAYFVEQAVQAGMIGLALSNADALVAPWGARERYLGTNPLSLGIPAGKEPPLIVDMATSASAHGRILLAKERGESIPLGWALDKEGRPTTDPTAALEGALLPFGGPKGSALSLAIDLLCGPLAGALTGPFITPLFQHLNRPQGLGHLFLALRVEMFTDPSEFAAQMDESLRRIRSLTPAAGFERVYLPGEPERLRKEQHQQSGLYLDDFVWVSLT